MTQAGKAVIDQQERAEGGAPGDDLGAPFSFGPLRRAHLLITGQGPAVVLPDGSRAPSGGGSAGVSSLAGIYQQTPTAACASDGTTPMRWGLGELGHQQAARGIYLCIACHYHQPIK